MPESHGVCVDTDTLGLSVFYNVHAFELDRTGGSLNAISLSFSIRVNCACRHADGSVFHPFWHTRDGALHRARSAPYFD